MHQNVQTGKNYLSNPTFKSIPDPMSEKYFLLSNCSTIASNQASWLPAAYLLDHKKKGGNKMKEIF